MTKEQALREARVIWADLDCANHTADKWDIIAAALLEAQSHVFAELAKAIPPLAIVVDDLRRQADELRKGE